MPSIIIVAGPNGAGKSTWIQGLRKIDSWRAHAVLNADQIIVSSGGQPSNFAKARVAVTMLEDLITDRMDVILETTLATRRLAQKIPVWRGVGYQVELIYLGLPSVEHSILRVRDRVSKGGHSIPEDALRRRFPLSRQYLDELYKPSVHAWTEFEIVNGEHTLLDFGMNDWP